MKWAVELCNVSFDGEDSVSYVAIVDANKPEDAAKFIGDYGYSLPMKAKVYSCGVKPVGEYWINRSVDVRPI